MNGLYGTYIEVFLYHGIQSRIEGGQTAMSVEIFRKMIEILETDANVLLGKEGGGIEKQESVQEVLYRIQKMERIFLYAEQVFQLIFLKLLLRQWKRWINLWRHQRLHQSFQLKNRHV